MHSFKCSITVYRINSSSDSIRRDCARAHAVQVLDADFCATFSSISFCILHRHDRVLVIRIESEQQRYEQKKINC